MKPVEVALSFDQYLTENRPSLLVLKTTLEIRNKLGFPLNNRALDPLYRLITDLSGGRVSHSDGRLLQLWDHQVLFQSDDGGWIIKDMSGMENPDFIRGMYYETTLDGVWHQCIILDRPVKGPHRIHFDSKSSKNQVMFLRNFAERDQQFEDVRPKRLPRGYVSITTDDEHEFKTHMIADFEYFSKPSD